MTDNAQPAGSPHARSIQALAILAALAGLAGLWAFVLASDLSDLGTSVRQKKSEVQAFRARLEGRDKNKARQLSEPYLEGATPSLASNALQERVVRVVEAAGGTIVSISVEPQTAAVGLTARLLTAQVVAEMTIDAVQRALHRLETEPPALIVEGLLLDRRTAGASETDDPTRPTRLRIDARVVGFVRSGRP